jgi:hypothetical protein
MVTYLNMNNSIILQASVRTGGRSLVVTHQNYCDARKLVATCKRSKIRCYGNPPANIHMPFILKINYARKGCANATRALFSIMKFVFCTRWKYNAKAENRGKEEFVGV